MVNSPSVVEISSWLQKADRKTKQVSPVHHSWEPSARASLVILWGLLIYPLLDPDLKQQERKISVDLLNHLFHEYLGGQQGCAEVISRLCEHDYIRLIEQNLIVPGTRLFTAVDAARMYPLFRSSVLSRKLVRAAADHDRSTD